MRSVSLAFAAVLAISAAACTGSRPTPRVPAQGDQGLAAAFDAALMSEQLDPAERSMTAYLDVVDRGLAAGQGGELAVLGALDALVWRDAGLGRVSALHSLAFRAPNGIAVVTDRLTKSYGTKSGHPIARAAVAQALLDLARFRGDAAAAATARKATGAAQEATIVGPLAWASFSAIASPLAIEAPSAPLPATFAGVGPFARELRPITMHADDAWFDTTLVNVESGLFALVVDVDVPRAQKVWIALRSTSAAVVVAGGKETLTRPFAIGGGVAARYGNVDLPAGKARVVVRLGTNDDAGRAAVSVLGEDGEPLATNAPKPGDAATTSATHAEPYEIDPARAPSVDVPAAALMTLGDPRAARRALEPTATKEDVSPERALLFARAVNRSDDLPETKKIERARTAYGRAHAAWPVSWEAIIGDAYYAAARKGAGEGRVETLRDMAMLRAAGEGGATLTLDPMVRAFEVATAAEIGMRDIALAGYEELKPSLARTPILAELDDKTHPRTGAEAQAFACSKEGVVDRQSMACLQEHSKAGDHAGVIAEIARLRELRGDPRALESTELAERLAQGNTDALLKLYDAMPEGERALAFLGALPRDRENDLKSRLDRDLLSAHDSPANVAELLRLLGDDPARAMDAEGAKAVADDRAHPDGTNAATLVLLHDERYTLSASGFLRLTIHDVRRVAGTTDVEQGAGGTLYGVVGREARRTLRRRILKKDGRVLEPDRASFASQGNADLSQLEPGDYIEQTIEGFALPDRAGHIVVDTPDVLPERTTIKKATIELRYPKNVVLHRWSHPLLGKAVESEGMLRWTIQNQQPRRFEEGVPRMDRDVSVSFGTYTWDVVATQLAELVRSLEDKDPFVAKWARDAAGDATPGSKAMVERVVAAAGKTVRVANGGMLSDLAASLNSGPQQLTARNILELGQGSRAWVIYRALEELGIKAELVLAEREPFSADPAYPARPSRFDRPLLIAHLPQPDGDLWIDADVSGPPLPAGRVTPELRGRQALSTTGAMVEVGGAGTDGARDEVDVRLAVNERGDAKGTFALILRGRQAQGLADALETVVGSERREMLRRVVLGWLPWANVDDVTLGGTEGSWEISLRAQVSIPSFAQGEGKSWRLPGLEPLHAVFPRPSVSTVAAMYATRLGRESALAIDDAFQYHVHRRIDLPAGSKVSSSVAPVSVKLGSLDATRSSTIQGSAIEEEFTFSLATGTISTADYAKFAEAAKRVDDGFLAGTRVDH